MKSVLSGERRGAHRHDPFTKEQFGVVIGKVAVADANGRIKSSCLDVGIALEEPQPNVERMQGCAQRLESGNEPELGDTGMGGEHERTAVVGELTNTGVDPVESGGDMAVEGLTGVGQLTAIRGTGEKVPTRLRSRARICRVTAGWVMPSSRAAAEKPPRRAAASNTARRWSRPTFCVTKRAMP